MISLALDGTPVLYFKDTLLRPRVYDEESGYVVAAGLSANRKVKNIRILNGDKWMTDNSSNIAYVHGNVGIGTTQAAYTLDVKGDIRATGNLLIEGLTTTVDTQNLSIEDAIVEIGRGNDGGTSGKDVGFLFTRNNGADTTNSNVALIYDESTDRLTFGYSDGSPTASTLAINTSKSLDVVIPSGRLGVGTASPALDLHVMGGIITQNNGAITPQIQFKSGANNTNGWLVRANISDTFAGDFTIDRQDNSVTPSKFVIKNGGNVGIGTTNPGQALHIYRSGANNAVIKAEAAGTQEAEIQLYHTGDAAAWGMYMPVNSDSLRFYRNGDRMTLTSGGNVGIGTVSPEGSLHVQGSRSIFGNNAGASDIIINDVPQARWRVATGGYALTFSKHNSASDEYSTWSEKVRIDQNGNVGIGTNAPRAKLDARGDSMIFDKARGDGSVLTGLYNYMSTQLLIDTEVFLSRGTTTASTDIDPPPGVAGDVICKFVNSYAGEAVAQDIPVQMPVTTGDTIYFGAWYYAPSVNVTIQLWGGGGGGPSTNFVVGANGVWQFIERTVTSTTTGTINIRIDNDTGGSTVYITGLTVRKNPSQTTGLPFTPRYSPIDGKGAVFATQNLVAKEAAIKTLTGNVGIGTASPEYALDVNGALRSRYTAGRFSGTFNTSGLNMGNFAEATDAMPQIGWEIHLSFSVATDGSDVSIYGAYRHNGTLFGASEKSTIEFREGTSVGWANQTNGTMSLTNRAYSGNPYYAIIRVHNPIYTNADAGNARHHITSECVGVYPGVGATIWKSVGYVDLGGENSTDRFNILRIVTTSGNIKGQWTAFPITI
jgi:hypothetical protein